jgi:hypothetical protein
MQVINIPETPTRLVEIHKAEKDLEWFRMFPVKHYE